MFRKTFLASALTCVSATCVFADFTYEQTTKITGGMMAGMMKFAGAFSKQAREPMVSTVVVKGDKMAHINAHQVSIIDLASETITNVNLDKKQYSVMTFAEMTQALQRMTEKAAKGKTEGDPNAELNFKVSVNNTGQTKVVNGFNAKEMIMTLAMEGTDKKSGQTGGLTLTNDMWISPKVAGYNEVQDFQKRMMEKLAWSPGGLGLGAMMSRPEMIKGMAEAAKEMSKIDGIPVLIVMKMGGMATGGPDQQMGGNQPQGAQPQQQQQPPPPKADVGEMAGNSAGSAIGRKLGGGFGGLAGGALGGGFGRKKKKDDDQAAQQQQPPAQQQTAGTQAAGQQDMSGVLMEATTEISSFSSAPVDPAKFEVPGGFKKVESDMEKSLRQ